jgi:hypothetical protein
VTTPHSSPRDPLALDRSGVLVELHLIRSGDKNASHQIAVYLPATVDEYAQQVAYTDLDPLSRDQRILALVADIYDYLATRLVERTFAHYDATSPVVIAGLFSAWYTRTHEFLFALTLTPDQAVERAIPAERRYVLRMREGFIPAQWELFRGDGRFLAPFGAMDKRATTKRSAKKRGALRLADEVDPTTATSDTTAPEVAWQLNEFETLEKVRERFVAVRNARGNTKLTGE